MASTRSGFAQVRRGQGPPVLFLHGWLTGSALWRPLFDAMGPEAAWAFEAIAPDLAGSADTGGTAPVDLTEHAAALWSWVEALELDGPLDVVGHSMGGAIATLMATQKPARVRRLVLVCPVPPGGFVLPDHIFAAFDGVGADPAALRGFFEPQIPASELDWMVELCARTNLASARNTLRGWTGASFVDTARTLPHAPLVVAGTEDPFLGPSVLREAVVDLIPGARLVEVAGGHYPMLDATAELAACVADALTRPE